MWIMVRSMAQLLTFLLQCLCFTRGQTVISRSQGERVDKVMKAVGDRGQPIHVVVSTSSHRTSLLGPTSRSAVTGL